MTQSTTDLRTHFRGPVLSSGDEGYDQARMIWNGMFDRRPNLIARCSGAADVIAAVNFARENGLAVAVRGGGHSFPGHSVCDDGLMIDLSPMKSVRVDPVNKTARAEPGVLWGEFDREAEAFGLATTGGMISHTGIAGLTLGGGFGWLARRHGLVIDNLLACDVVTADGRLLHASATENADLFWALRGGGGNFGIVTSFKYRLHELAGVFGGLVAYPLPEAPGVLKGFEELLRETSRDVIAGAFMLTTPDGNRAIGIAPVHLGADPAEGERLTLPFRRLGTPVMEQVGPMPYSALQALIDGAVVPQRRYYMRSNFMDGFGNGASEALTEAFAQCPSPFSAVVIAPFGGAVAEVARDETAFYHRDAKFSMTLLGCWLEPQDDAANMGWVRDTWDKVQPFASTGVYVNELFNDEGADRVRSAYGPAFERLQEAKRKYDPTNLFRMNQNIQP